MDNDFGIKDIYQGMLLAKTPININGIQYNENDIVLLFDSIQEIHFMTQESNHSARGGVNNRKLIEWKTTQAIDCSLDMGNISQLGYGIVNGEVLQKRGKVKSIRQIETCALEGRAAFLKHNILVDKPVRVFKKNGSAICEEILDFTVKKNTIILKDTLKDEIVVDYFFSEEIYGNTVTIGSKSLQGKFKFVGKFYYTNEQQSKRKTAIIEIPELTIKENFNLHLGRSTDPFISAMRFSAVPQDNNLNTPTAQIIFLDKDIDEDF